MKPIYLVVCCLVLSISCYSQQGPASQGSFTDTRDGHVYKTVTIGTQTWMAENLAWLPSVFPSDSGSQKVPLYYVYDYEGTDVSAAKASVNYSTYGVLYNWPATKIACPAGWHYSSYDEWKVLLELLGMEPDEGGYDRILLSGEVGEKLKATTGWNIKGNGDNSTGFNALPAGFRFNSGDFDGLGFDTFFWSGYTYKRTMGHYYFGETAVTNDSAAIARKRMIEEMIEQERKEILENPTMDVVVPIGLAYSTHGVVMEDTGDKKFGLSLRCIKD